MRERIRVLAQVEAIRRSGKTNMLEKTTVQRIAYECEYYSLVNFIEECEGEDYINILDEAASSFDNPTADLPVSPVPDNIEFTVTL